MKDIAVIKERITLLEQTRDNPPLLIKTTALPLEVAEIARSAGDVNFASMAEHVEVIVNTAAINAELAILYWVITD